MYMQTFFLDIIFHSLKKSFINIIIKFVFFTIVVAVKFVESIAYFAGNFLSSKSQLNLFSCLHE